MAELDCYLSMVFKPRQEAARNKQPRLDGRDDEVHVSAVAVAARDRPSVGAATVMEQDDDATLLLNTTALNLGANDGGV